MAKVKVGAVIVDGINRFLDFIARNIKNAIIFIGVALLLAGIMVLSYSATFNFIKTDEFETYDPDGEVVTINIPEGSTAKEIGELLKEAGLVENVLLFRIKAKLTGAENNFQYGVYKIVQGMPEETIMEVLQEGGKAESVTITIPEGWSIRQIAQYLKSRISAWLRTLKRPATARTTTSTTTAISTTGPTGSFCWRAISGRIPMRLFRKTARRAS